MADDDHNGFVFYRYKPSIVAAALFTVLFFLSAIHHTIVLVRRRAWYFIPFLIGCLFEAVGYIGRIMSSNESPDFTLGPYIIQSLLILLAPALFAASIYMLLGRTVLLLDAPQHSLIRPRFMTKVFVAGDVLSFLVQSGAWRKIPHTAAPSDACLLFPQAAATWPRPRTRTASSSART
ncbi:hypothetical protein VTK73DRAFT_833 [Phialemonium thermophilum]|uniref:Uncharacterized protein n=1 Tax=Phialemonium thermophilum TaxID=223376 RepID=A0ABR3VU66_9PEZI